MPKWLESIIEFVLGLLTRNRDLEERVENLKTRAAEDTRAREEEDPLDALRKEFFRK